MPLTLITGAAGHLGSALATAIAQRGSELVLADRSGPALERVAVRLRSGGASVVAVEADLTRDADVERVVSSARSRFGAIDVCVNNCGIEGQIDRLEDLNLERVIDLYQVNVFLALRLMKQLIPHFKATRAGRIINIASGAGLAGTEFMAAYSSSKHAVIGLTRSAARELAPYNVPVNAVCPGVIASPMMSRIERGLEIGRAHVCPGVIASPMMSRIERGLEALTGQPASFEHAVPMGRYADASEVANLVSYLALDAPLYLTGAALVIDGALRA